MTVCLSMIESSLDGKRIVEIYNRISEFVDMFDYKRIQANYKRLDKRFLTYYNPSYNKLVEGKAVMDNQLTVIDNTDFSPIIKMVKQALDSELSRVMYEKALTDFLTWYQDQRKTGLTKAVVNEYKDHLKGLGYAPSSINQKLSAIRRLAVEASDNGLIDGQIASGISRVKGIKKAGVRIGNWLTKDQAEKLINSTDKTTLKGLRDRAILAIMISTGLRRSEVADLTFDHIQQRDGRWVIADMIGKGNRVRTIPMPSWTKVTIDQWTQSANITDGHVFRSVNRHDSLSGDSMTSQAIQDVVKLYADKSGLGLSAHDLRRTYAKLAYRGGSDMLQIQLSLGHESSDTTKRYLGEVQDLTNAPCDFIGIRLDE